MSWTVEYLPAQGVIAVTATGEVSNADAEAQVAEVIRLLKQNHALRILVDYSEAVSEVSLPTLYNVPDHCTKSGAVWNVWAAVVLPRTRYRIDTYHFFELVCHNAGYNVRLFDSTDAAEHWLHEQSPGASGPIRHSEARASLLGIPACAHHGPAGR